MKNPLLWPRLILIETCLYLRTVFINLNEIFTNIFNKFLLLRCLLPENACSLFTVLLLLLFSFYAFGCLHTSSMSFAYLREVKGIHQNFV